MGIELSFEVDDFFTLYLDFNSPMAVMNVSNALNKNVSVVDSSGTFFSSLTNNQNARGDDTITSTQQTYNYQSTQGCYSKQVKAINSALGIKSHKAIMYLLFKFLQAFESKTMNYQYNFTIIKNN